MKSVIVFMALWLLGGCATKIDYGDATAVETTTIDFGSTDLQQMASSMVDSLLSFPPMVEATRERRPVIFVEKVSNKTTEHIDTESITDTISNRLLRSGKFRFVDMGKSRVALEQMEFQNSGLVDRSTAVKIGRQIGAEYMMYGNLAAIDKRDGDSRDLYYKFTLRLMHLESGLIEWSDEKEIRKTAEKSLFGL